MKRIKDYYRRLSDNKDSETFWDNLSFAIHWLVIVSVIGFALLNIFIPYIKANPDTSSKMAFEKRGTKVTLINIVPEVTEVIGTLYNPVVAQCDADPLITADNSKISLSKLENWNIKWCALSRDLLKRWGGPYDYGDTLRVHHSNDKIRGLWIVHDTMNKRFKKRIDFLVHTVNNSKFPHYTEHILISNTDFYNKR